MKIPIKPETPKYFEGNEEWEKKTNGVILVEEEKDIIPLWELLCVQDDYWEDYKYLIKVAPKEITSPKDLDKLCSFTGQTNIYNPEEIKKIIPFIMYQSSL